MPRAAMGRPWPRATLSGLGRPMASLGIFHIHRASGGGASISQRVTKRSSHFVIGHQNNPFLSDGQQPAYTATGARLQGQGDQQYYGRGYSQAQSGYSSAGLGKLG